MWTYDDHSRMFNSRMWWALPKAKGRPRADMQTWTSFKIADITHVLSFNVYVLFEL